MHARSCGFFGGTTFSPTCCSDCSCSSHQSSCPRFISFPHSFNNSGWWKYSHIDNVSAPLLALHACERLFCRDRVGFRRIRKLEAIFLLTWFRWENRAVVLGADVSDPPSSPPRLVPAILRAQRERQRGVLSSGGGKSECKSRGVWRIGEKGRDETRLWIKQGNKAGKRWREGMVTHAVAAQSR